MSKKSHDICSDSGFLDEETDTEYHNGPRVCVLENSTMESERCVGPVQISTKDAGQFVDPIDCKVVVDTSDPGHFVEPSQCTVDDLVMLMRNSSIEKDDIFGFINSQVNSDSLGSYSTDQTEDRKSALKQASVHKKKLKSHGKNMDSKPGEKLRRTKSFSGPSSSSDQAKSGCKSSPIRRNVSINPPEPDSEEKSTCDSYWKKLKVLSRLHSMYDSRLERSKTFLHGQSKVFSKASQYLTPAKPGLRKLQVCYSKTNMENNKGKIFGDLVKTAHKQNIIICETVHNIEKRLYRKRTDPSKKTTFYNNKNMADPFRTKKKKAQTVAEKKQERKERITDTTDEIKLGFKRTAKTKKALSSEEVEKLKSCRYLRIDPTIQLREEEDASS